MEEATTTTMSSVNVIRMEEVRKHEGDKESVWFVIHDKVYDVSDFLEDVSERVESVPLRYFIR